MATEPKYDIELGFTKQDMGQTYNAVLQVWTYKYEGRIVSSVQVFWVGDQSRMTELFGDFDKTVLTTKQRGTQKAIDRQHAEAFTADKVAELVQAAKDHTAKRLKIAA